MCSVCSPRRRRFLLLTQSEFLMGSLPAKKHTAAIATPSPSNYFIHLRNVLDTTDQGKSSGFHQWKEMKTRISNTSKFYIQFLHFSHGQRSREKAKVSLERGKWLGVCFSFLKYVAPDTFWLWKDYFLSSFVSIAGRTTWTSIHKPAGWQTWYRVQSQSRWAQFIGLPVVKQGGKFQVMDFPFLKSFLS